MDVIEVWIIKFPISLSLKAHTMLKSLTNWNVEKTKWLFQKLLRVYLIQQILNIWFVFYKKITKK